MSNPVQEIFEQVCDLPEDQRQAILAEKFRDQPELRADVESLLGAHQQAGDFLAQPTAEFVRPDSDYLSASIGVEEGEVIDGRYKILQQIGEGGFGVVYMAQQIKPVKRKVALKIIKLGMDTKQVVARFEAERQALAMMSHANIARVLDGGATRAGRPYFVMELVRGDPITEYCNAKRLTTEQRLELFQQVCGAVQHAHQKGIIHRDIKPTNVLVTVANDKPLAKVIDFGIAKATNSELTDKTLFTEFRQLIGTPEYMSPEQAERSGVDVDTRTDIYSLGVLLYEMLTGATPFDVSMRTADWGTVQQMILREDPPTPSNRLSTRADQLDTVALERSIEPRKLRDKLKGELDWIVMKALEKDRTRRYSTTVELEADIDRYLTERPVLAGPPNAMYRWKKYARRYRGWLAAAGAVLAALLLAVVGTTATMFWALHEREHARHSEFVARKAEERAKRFSAMSSVLMSPGEMETARKAWEDEIEKLRANKSEIDPERLRQECQYATWLWSRGNFQNVKEYRDQARELLRELFPRAKQVLGVSDINTFGAGNALIQALQAEGAKAEEVVGYYHDVVQALRDIYGESHVINKEVTLEYAAMLLRAGQAERSEQEFSTYLRLNEDTEEYSFMHKVRLKMAKRAIDGSELEDLLPVHDAILALHEEHASGIIIELPKSF